MYKEFDPFFARFATFLPRYLLFLFFTLVYIGLSFVRERDGWVLGEWAINYSGGFIRRGLLGECALLAGNLLHVSPLFLIFLVQMLCYAAMLWSVWALLRRLRWSIWLVLLVFSPATLSFTIFSPHRAFHKEILFLALFSLLVANAQRWRKSLGYCLPLALTVVILTHEAAAFYLPYVFCAIILAYRSVKLAVAEMLIPFIMFFVAAEHPGTSVQASSVCRSVGGYDLHSGICDGAIRYLSYGSGRAHADAVASMHYFHLWIEAPYIFCLAIFPVALGIYVLWNKCPGECKWLIICSTVSWLASLTLFWFTTDWDRWIYIHTFSCMLLLLMIERQRQATL